MRKVSLLLFSCLLASPAMGQGQESVLADTLYSVYGVTETPVAMPALKLPKYQPNACLMPSLMQLIHADKGCGDNIGYYFSTTKTGSKDLVKVMAATLGRVRPGNFFGYFMCGNRVFLCLGKNESYLAKAATTDTLRLSPYLSKGPVYDDFFLGGDADGTVRPVRCDTRLLYALIKPCTPQHKRRKNTK